MSVYRIIFRRRFMRDVECPYSVDSGIVTEDDEETVSAWHNGWDCMDVVGEIVWEVCGETGFGSGWVGTERIVSHVPVGFGIGPETGTFVGFGV